MKQTKPAQAMELRSLSPVFDGRREWRGTGMAGSSIDTQLSQMMESVRKQDELVHGWTRTLVTVQGGLLTAVGVLWASSAVGVRVKTATTISLAVVAIVACWTCAFAAVSDLAWQGRYIRYVKTLEPTLFSDVSPDPEKPGRQAVLYKWLGWAMTAFWALAIVIAIAKWWRLS
jgi:hypothetical protein